jgi:hypothetical protein
LIYQLHWTVNSRGLLTIGPLPSLIWPLKPEESH